MKAKQCAVQVSKKTKVIRFTYFELNSVYIRFNSKPALKKEKKKKTKLNVRYKMKNYSESVTFFFFFPFILPEKYWRKSLNSVKEVFT